LRAGDFDRLGVDHAAVLKRAERIRAAGPEIAEKVRRVFARERAAEKVDVDAALYEGFIGDGDKRLIAQVRGTPPHLLAKAQYAFRDARLPELLFRYRARNWPDTLTQPERVRWDAYRRQRLIADSGLSELTFDGYFHQIDALRAQHTGDRGKLDLLDHLQVWGDDLRITLS
jgi:exodeoxyribonuclease-1